MTLAALAPPILFTVFAWWFSTGLILLLLRLPPARHGRALGLYGAIAIAATGGIAFLARESGVMATYAGFTLALLVWGWHEASFLMGKITGPRPAACPPGAQGWSRFGFATMTVLHHEIALALTAAALWALTAGEANPIAGWTFALLFAMRLSAKFNIFLGVPNLSDEFFPPHLAHLKTYLPRRAMSALMPLSLLGSLVFAAWAMERATRAHAAGDPATATGLVIIFALTMMAFLEHAFMILPVRDAALWRWAAPRRPAEPAPDPAGPAGKEAGR
jgi:putative photosynthetic complex assembly protein 2